MDDDDVQLRYGLQELGEEIGSGMKWLAVAAVLVAIIARWPA